MADNKNTTPDQLKTIEESLTKAEMYVEDNKKTPYECCPCYNRLF